MFQLEDMDVIVNAAGHVERLPAGVPGQAVKGVRYLHDLALDRGMPRDVIDEDVFSRFLGKALAGEISVAVIAAGEDEKRLAIGTDGRGHRLTGEEVGARRQVRVQRSKDRPLSRLGGDPYPSGEEFSGCGSMVFLGVQSGHKRDHDHQDDRHDSVCQDSRSPSLRQPALRRSRCHMRSCHRTPPPRCIHTSQ
jgi:hypothetical protein